VVRLSGLLGAVISDAAESFSYQLSGSMKSNARYLGSISK
jgi:hypothetical protein